MRFPIVLRVPGSTANIGAGFDCLGLAVASYIWCSDDPSELSDRPSMVECDDHHIANKAYKAAGGTEPMWFAHSLPAGKGMGFSAAARVGGAALAFLQQGASQEEARKKSLEVAIELEGHGDNAGACAHGGLVAQVGDVTYSLAAKLPSSIYIWVADHEMSTNKARVALSNELKLADVVSNIAGIAAILMGFYENNFEAIGHGADMDRIHQSRRLEMMEDSKAAYDLLVDHGAAAAWLSGAGPSIAAFGSDDLLSHADELPASGRLSSFEIDCSGLVRL